MTTQPILIAGQWRASKSTSTFQAENPTTREPLPEVYPVSSWDDCEAALSAASEAFWQMQKLSADQIAAFLEDYAARLDQHKQSLCEYCHLETAYPVKPRLADVEMVRTIDQIRQSAAAARDGSWSQPTIDTKLNIRSNFGPLGPVCVFGPNNFPLAYGSVSGGDFAAAIAAGNPVIGKANTSHPGVTRRMAELALESIKATGMPDAMVQLIYRTSHEDGERLVGDHRVGATGYTGSRSAGLKLKAAADRAGKPIYLELSSVNPVVILPGALAERLNEVADQFGASCLMGVGQMCTNPGLIVLQAGELTEQFITAIAEKFRAAPVGTLLSKSVQNSLDKSIQTLQAAGAKLLVGGKIGGGTGYSHANTLLRVTGKQFLADPEKLQTEAFGNASLLVVADDLAQISGVIGALEGNLTGSIYTDTRGGDDAAYATLAPKLRQQVGRLLNDKMPTGVAVTASMNHGGPYPATGHPGFTAVGVPAALVRFGMLQCFDAVREPRLPNVLRNKNPTGKTWRRIDGEWTQRDV